MDRARTGDAPSGRSVGHRRQPLSADDRCHLCRRGRRDAPNGDGAYRRQRAGGERPVRDGGSGIAASVVLFRRRAHALEAHAMIADGEYAIETTHLTRRFGSFVAVDGVTLRIPKGHLYGFLGLNGAGKTTTIRMLTTLLPPSAGSAKLWGHDVKEEPLAVRRLLGLVSDETSESQSTWTAREYLGYFARLRELPKPGHEVERILDAVGLEPRLRGKLIRSYSTGMKRRVEIGRALMGGPKVLFLDEPTRGLDLRPKRVRWPRRQAPAARGQGPTLLLRPLPQGISARFSRHRVTVERRAV